MEWLTEEEYLAITAGGDKKVLDDVLSRVYNKAIEQALCHIPDIVNKLSKKVKNINSCLDVYFKDNPKFLEYKDIVIKTVQQIEIEFTGMTFEDILEKAKPEIERKIALIGGTNG